MAAAEPVEFTRGSLGAADTRGLSLVERHAEARARAQEEETLARMQLIFGQQVPLSVLALAVSASAAASSSSSSSGGADAREAEALVREFLADKGKELEKLFRRDDSGDGEEAKKKKIKKPSTSSDDDDGDGDSDSDSDSDESDEGRKGRHRSSKRKKESKKHSKKSKRKGSKKDDKKHKKKKKRRRNSDSDGDSGEERAKAASKPTTAALTSQYGSHGLLRAENPHDAELKRSEFFAWCSEVKKVQSMEALARWEEAELWKTFVEDFNTATLPSDKYYDLMAWQQRKAREEAKKRRGKGGEEGEEAPISAVDDEAARRAEARRRREEEAAERLKEAYNALKYSDAGKKEDMKRQELLKIELRVAARTGDTEKVARLQKLLAPDPK